MSFNELYDPTKYIPPISSRSLVKFNGIDIRSFGLELIELPDLLLPGTTQQTVSVSDRSGSIPYRDNYNNWSFNLELQATGITSTNLQQNKLKFYRWLHTQSNNFIRGIHDQKISGILFEFVPNNIFYTTGTITNSASSKVVTGTGTKFKSYASVGASFEIAGDSKIYTVENIVSDTVIHLSETISSANSSAVSYRLERRKYLIVDYNGASDVSPLRQRGFHRVSNVSVNSDHTSENLSVGLQTSYPYWVGDEFEYISQNSVTGDSDWADDAEGGGFFHEIEGAGSATLKPNITYMDGGSNGSPRIVDSYYSFVSNFDGSERGRSLFNDKWINKTELSNEYLHVFNKSDIHANSMYVGSSADQTVKGLLTVQTRSDTSTPSDSAQPLMIGSRGHLSVRIRPDFDTTSNRNHFIFDSRTGSSSNNLAIYWDTTSDTVKVSIGSVVLSTSATPVKDDWYNIQVKWNLSGMGSSAYQTNNITFYFARDTGSGSWNGNTVTGSFTSIDNMGATVAIGHDYYDSNQFNGLIDDFAIWGVTLADSEVLSLRQGNGALSIATHSLLAHLPDNEFSDELGTLIAHVSTGNRYLVTYNSTDGSDDTIYDISTETRELTAPVSNDAFSFTDRLILYDEIGSFLNAMIYDSTNSPYNNGTRLKIQKDDFDSNQAYGGSDPGLGTFPDLPELGVFGEFSGENNDYYFRKSNWQRYVDSVSGQYRVLSFWAKLDKAKTGSYGISSSPDDDRAYLFHKLRGSGVGGHSGYGFAFSNDWKPRFVTYNAATNADKFHVEALSNDTPTQSAEDNLWDLVSYQHTADDFWLENIQFNFSGPSVDYEMDPQVIRVHILKGDDLDFSTTYFARTIDSTSSVFFTPNRPILCLKNDTIRITYKNPSANNDVYVSIKLKELDRTSKQVVSNTTNDFSVNDDRWHHYFIMMKPNPDSSSYYVDISNNDDRDLLVRYDFAMWVDGLKVMSTTMDNVNLAVASKDSFVIGKHSTDVGGNQAFASYTFPGSITDFRVWEHESIDFIGNESNMQKYASRLATRPQHDSVTLNYSTYNRSETTWWKFNDPDESSNIKDQTGFGNHLYVRSGGAIEDYNSTYGRTQKVYLSKNILSDGWKVGGNAGGFVSRGYFDNVSQEGQGSNNDDIENNTITALGYDPDDTSVKPHNGLKMIKMNPNGSTAYSNEEAITRFFTLKLGSGGGVDWGITDSEYVLRTWVYKKSTATTSVLIESFHLDSGNQPKQETTSIKNTTTNEWELLEMSFHNFGRTGSNIQHNTILIHFMFDDSNRDMYIDGGSVYKNMIPNGGFNGSSPISGWSLLDSSSTDSTISADSTYYHSGSNSLKIVISTTEAKGVKSSTFSTGSAPYYEISFWARRQTGTGSISLIIYSGGSRENLLTTELTTSFVRYSVIWKTNAYSSSNSHLLFKSTVDNTTINIDDVCMLPREAVECSKTVASDNTSLAFNTTIHDYGINVSENKKLYYEDIVGNKDSGAFIVNVKSDLPTTLDSKNNLIANGDFETINYQEGWNAFNTAATGSASISSEWTLFHSGSESVEIGNHTSMRQGNIGLGHYKSYYFSAYVYVASGTLTISLGEQNYYGSDIDTVAWTETVSTTGAWVNVNTILNFPSGVEGQYLVKFDTSTNGVAYVDDVVLGQIMKSNDSSVLFSWFGRDSNEMQNQHEIRLVYDPLCGFALQSSNNLYPVVTLAQYKPSFTTNDIINISGWWDKDGVVDSKDNNTYYVKMFINGILAEYLFSSDISSYLSSYNLDHLFVGAEGINKLQGSYVKTAKHFTTGVIDSLSLFARSITDEELFAEFTKNQNMINTNSKLSSSVSTTTNDILKYDFTKAGFEKYTAADNSVSNLMSTSDKATGDFKGLTVSDDKAVMYVKTNDYTTQEIRVNYRPHFR